MIMEKYFEGQRELILRTLEELTLISAPSFHEEKRAEYCIKWLEKSGITAAEKDECGNVILSFADEKSCHNRIFMAHLDTVFSADTKLGIKKDGELWRCPGIGDDTANAVCLLMLVRYLWENEASMLNSCIFVWNVCEEGLGNLAGSRAVMKKFRNITDCVISFDLYSDSVYSSSVGSLRYEIGVHTDGGHSYHDFGRTNAIAVASKIISELYGYIPDNDDSVYTTYNAGTIKGGTSVNVIASDCTFLWEFRSNDRRSLKKADEHLRDVTGKFDSQARINIDVIGERPCMGSPDKNFMEKLAAICEAAVSDVTGKKPVSGAASTDCNIPLSLDVPAVCVGLICGGNAHRTDEWIDVSSLSAGCIIAFKIFEKIKKEL